MREIKFRAWDKTTKTMYDVRELEWADGEILTAYIGLHTSDLENIELMQFTGLHDKTARRFTRGIYYEVARGIYYEVARMTKCGEWTVLSLCIATTM
jgi:hypothetical protein